MFGDRDHGHFSHVHLEELLNNQDHLSDSLQESLTSQDDGTVMAAADVDPENVTAGLSYGPGVSIAQADYDKDTVVDELKDDGFEEEGTHKGYTVLVGSESSTFARQGVGVTGNKIVSGRSTGDSDAEDVVETAIDVGEGDEERYVDANEDMNTLVDVLGVGSITTARTLDEIRETDVDRGRFKGQVGLGRQYDVGGKRSDVKQVILFDDANDVDTGDVEDWQEQQADSNYSIWAQADNVDVGQNGRAAVIAGDVPTDEIHAE